MGRTRSQATSARIDEPSAAEPLGLLDYEVRSLEGRILGERATTPCA